MFFGMVIKLVFAVPYQAVNVKDIIDYGKNLDPATQQESYYAIVNEQKLAALVAQLEPMAGSYPTHFDTPKDQSIATEQVTLLVNLLEVVTTEKSTRGFLEQVGRLNNIAYNLDIKDSARRIEKISQFVFAKSPDDIQMHYLMGNFKAGQGNLEVGIEHLTKAAAVNYAPAFFSLGLAYFMKGDKVKSLALLEKYKALVPEDQRTEKLIKSIQKGGAKVMFTPVDSKK